MSSNQKPNLPEGTWTVNKEDKEKIRAFGRELSKFVFGYAKEHGEGRFHAKLVAGGFQYFMYLQKQKSALIGDDILITDDVIQKTGLGVDLEEPFSDPEPVVPETKEEKLARLKAEVAELDAVPDHLHTDE